jgi:hypothetical protein
LAIAGGYLVPTKHPETPLTCARRLEAFANGTSAQPFVHFSLNLFSLLGIVCSSLLAGNQNDPDSISGMVAMAFAGVAFGGGVGGIVLANEKSAVLQLSGRQTGLMLNADLSGLAISMR